MRQMVHGTARFESPKLDPLPRLVEELRAAVVIAIKTAAGVVPDNQPPFVSAQRGLYGFPTVGLGISREVYAYDIQPLIAEARLV